MVQSKETLRAIQQTQQSYDRIAEEYSERNRSLWDAGIMTPAIDLFVSQLQAGDLVLDVGCGPGFDAALLAERGLCVVGVDVSFGMLKIVRTECSQAAVQADMRCLPFGRTVAGLWVNRALQHVPRSLTGEALSEFKRVLCPGGCLLLSVKQGDGEEWDDTKYGRQAPRWCVYWQPNSIDRLLVQSGFAIEHAWSLQGTRSWLYRLVTPRKRTPNIGSKRDPALAIEKQRFKNAMMRFATQTRSKHDCDKSEKSSRSGVRQYDGHIDVSHPTQDGL